MSEWNLPHKNQLAWALDQGLKIPSWNWKTTTKPANYVKLWQRGRKVLAQRGALTDLQSSGVGLKTVLPVWLQFSYNKENISCRETPLICGGVEVGEGISVLKDNNNLLKNKATHPSKNVLSLYCGVVLHWVLHPCTSLWSLPYKNRWRLQNLFLCIFHYLVNFSNGYRDINKKRYCWCITSNQFPWKLPS